MPEKINENPGSIKKYKPEYGTGSRAVKKYFFPRFYINKGIPG